MDSLKLAQGLRGWQQKHPVVDAAIGFVPLAGQAYGLASTAAALRDPDASKLEKGMAAASVLPVGKAAQAARKIVVGSKTAENFPALKASLMEAKKLLNKWGTEASVDTVSKGPKGIKTLAAGDPRINDRLAKETGWWVDPDTGRMMTEISDHMSSIDRGMLEATHLNAGGRPAMAGFEDIVDHPELRKIDPEHIKQLNVEVDPTISTREGQYFSPANAVANNKPGETLRVGTAGWSPGDWGENRDYRDSIMHELQHSYANKEGYKRGTSPEVAGGWMEYLRDPGEMLARVSAIRRNLTPEGRRKYPFHKHMENERVRTMDPANRRYETEDDLRRAFALRNLNYDDYAVPAP